MMLKKKKTKEAKKPKKAKTAKKPNKAKAKAKPNMNATKAKSTKLSQSSSFGIGIEFCSAMKATPAVEPKPAIRYLLNPGRERLTEVEMMILRCAAQAKLTKEQWYVVLQKVGVGNFEEILEFHTEDYDGVVFSPLPKRSQNA